MTLTPQPGPGIRLAELVAALSLATDSARGRPLEQGLGVCLLAVGLGEDAGLGEDQLVRVWYGSLLRHIGCTADNHLLAEAVGDEIAFAAGLAGIDTTSPEAFGAHLAGHLRRMAGPTAAASLARLPALTSRMREATAAVCEVAELLADRLGLGLEVRRDLALGPSAGTAQGSWVRLPASRCPCPSGSSRWLRRPAWPPRTTGQGNPRRRPWPSCASAPAGPSTRGWSSASTPAASGCSLAWRPGRSGTRCWPASRAPAGAVRPGAAVRAAVALVVAHVAMTFGMMAPFVFGWADPGHAMHGM